MEPSRCNRCGVWVYDGAPLCPNCVKRYNEVYNNMPRIVNKPTKSHKIPSFLKLGTGITILIVFLISIYILLNTLFINQLDLESFPPHAQVFEFDEELFQTKTNSPLVLETEGNFAYFVKIIDLNDENTILSVFLYPNKVYEITIPEGYYRIEYAIGKRWENIQTYFGLDTKNLRIKDNLNFTPESGYHIQLNQNNSIEIGFINLNLTDYK